MLAAHPYQGMHAPTMHAVMDERADVILLIGRPQARSLIYASTLYAMQDAGKPDQEEEDSR
ncbi:hypothetical protein C7401_103412 [Paraburkholderia unamae]|nr:hypothetical protein C7401_103412 [Paraburkholderia unamae]